MDFLENFKASFLSNTWQNCLWANRRRPLKGVLEKKDKICKTNPWYAVMHQFRKCLLWSLSKRITNFFLSQFYLSFCFLFFFVNFKTVSIARPLIYYFIRHCNQLQYSDSPNSTYNWHVPDKGIIGIIEEISFFFFDEEDPVRRQKTISRNDTNIEKQGARIVKRKRL